MVTQRNYSCNLCHETVAEGSGIGIRWTGFQTIEITIISQSENHICQKCINSLQAALAKQAAHWKERDELDKPESGAR